MNKTQKPLMLAYILFLIISLLYHGVSSVLNIEFLAWERILVATTIASYFFTCSSACKFFVKIDTNTLNFANEHLKLSKQLRNKEENALVDEENKKALLKSGQEVIDYTTKIIMDTEKSIRKHTRRSFWYDVIGYLLFFCTITISPIYNFLIPAEEVVTLTAFVLILLIEYVESTYVAKVETAQQALLDGVKSSLKFFDEYNEQNKSQQ